MGAASSAASNADTSQWDAVIVSAPEASARAACCAALRERRRRGKLARGCHVAEAAPPAGSAAAALPVGLSLQVAAEFLRARASGSELTSAAGDGGSSAPEEEADVWSGAGGARGARVLLLTAGASRHFWQPCSSSLPVLDGDTLVSLLDYCLDSVSAERVGVVEAGVWVMSLDGLLLGLPRLEGGAGRGGSAKSLVRPGPHATVLLAQLSLRRDVSSFVRAIFDPISKEVEHLFPPQPGGDEAEDTSPDEGDSEDESGAGAFSGTSALNRSTSSSSGSSSVSSGSWLPAGAGRGEDFKVCGLVHLGLELCGALMALLSTPPFRTHASEVDLMDDVLEVLSSNCTLDHYLHTPRSLLPQPARRLLYKALHPPAQDDLGAEDDEDEDQGIAEEDAVPLGHTSPKHRPPQPPPPPRPSLSASSRRLSTGSAPGSSRSLASSRGSSGGGGGGGGGARHKPVVFRFFAADTGAALYSARSAAQYRTLQTSVVDAVGDLLTRLGYSAPGDPAAEGAGVRLAAASLDSATPDLRYSRASSDASAASAGSGSLRGRARTRSVLNVKHVDVSPDAQATNALLLGNGLVSAGALVENSKLSGEWAVNEDAAVLGVRGSRARALVVPRGVLVQELAQRGGGSALIAYKLSDEPDLTWPQGGTFMGLPWPALLKRTGLCAEDLWPAVAAEPPQPPRQQQQVALALAAAPAARAQPEAARRLRNARLFPTAAQDAVALDLAQFYLVVVLTQLAAGAGSGSASATPLKHVPPAAMYLSRAAYLRATRISLSEAEERADPAAETAWRAQLALRIDEFRIASVLLEGAPAHEAANAYEPILRRMAALGHTRVLDTLDDIACGRTTRPDVAWGALACSSLALDAFADAADAAAARDARDAGPKETLPEAATAVSALRGAAPGAKPQPQAVRRLADVRRALLGPLAPHAAAARAPEPIPARAAEALVSLAAHYRAVVDGRR